MSEKYTEEEYEQLHKRHQEVADLVGQIINRGSVDETYTYADVAKILVHQPAATALFTHLLQLNATENDVSAFITALVYEEVLQKTPTLSVVHEQRRLH